jgi:hypothetical protein
VSVLEIQQKEHEAALMRFGGKMPKGRRNIKGRRISKLCGLGGGNLRSGGTSKFVSFGGGGRPTEFGANIA